MNGPTLCKSLLLNSWTSWMVGIGSMGFAKIEFVRWVGGPPMNGYLIAWNWTPDLLAVAGSLLRLVTVVGACYERDALVLETVCCIAARWVFCSLMDLGRRYLGGPLDATRSWLSTTVR
ncbi:hypothetical protein ACLOJK_014779 [Asimina triloba]